jgi:hypothetical protein
LTSPVHDHRVEALLAPKVLVDQRLGDLGALRDLLYRGRLKALLLEHAASDIDELLAPLLSRHTGAPLFGFGGAALRPA